MPVLLLFIVTVSLLLFLLWLIYNTCHKSCHKLRAFCRANPVGHRHQHTSPNGTCHRVAKVKRNGSLQQIRNPGYMEVLLWKSLLNEDSFHWTQFPSASTAISVACVASGGSAGTASVACIETIAAIKSVGRHGTSQVSWGIPQKEVGQ